MYSPKAFEERRKHPRFQIVLPLDFEEIHGAVLYNLSEGGLLIHSIQNMPVDRELKVRVLFAEEYELNQFEATARIAWKGHHSESDWEGYKYALEFVEISPEDRQKLVNLLEEMSETWRNLLEMEKGGRDRSKRESSLGALEETEAPEKEEWEPSGARIEAPAESPERALNREEEFRLPTSLVADLAKRIKKTMVEMRDLALSSRGKFKDPALGQEFYRRMADHIDNSETDLDCFLDYLRIKSPVRQTNMIHVILEEALERHKKKLVQRGIRIFRKQFENGLPNASVHIEELRFILNWVLEYAIISVLPNQGIALLTRSLAAEGTDEAMRFLRQRGSRCVEIVIASGHYEDLSKQAEVPPEIRTDHGKSERSLILPLVDEIVQKNRGSLKLSEGRLRMVSLILPIERRKVVFYEQAPA